MTLNKYMAIKQYERPVLEYIVERERLETTLGKVITNEIKETSFRKGLNRYMRDNMIVFRGLPYEEYKNRAEDVDQDAKERRVGRYAMKQNPSSSSKSNENSNAEDSPKKENSSMKPQYSREDMMKQGICFECGEKGHLAKNCPNGDDEMKEENDF